MLVGALHHKFQHCSVSTFESCEPFVKSVAPAMKILRLYP